MDIRSIPSSARRERERAETRGKILESARRMFVQKGYEGTTMRAIAARIGYTPTAIYHHFKDKDALVAELAGLDFRALAQALQQTGSVGDPVERLERIGAAYVEFGLSHPMQYQFLFMTRRPKSGAQEALPRDPGEDAYGFLRQTCAAVIGTGRLRPEFSDPDELAQMCWGSLHGLVALTVAKGDDPSIPWRDVRQTAAKARGTTLRGILREPGP
jgi:AcrR family transcriptional regulator